MKSKLFSDALEIVNYSIAEVLPSKSVYEALKSFKKPKGNTYLIAIGKAAYSMTKEVIKNVDIYKGLIVTKYGHTTGPLKNIEIIEAGHPLLDENSLLAGKQAKELIKDATKDDTIIFLVSGGGSSLFEDSPLSLEELRDINDTLIKSGATINEINTIRKRISNLKGGKFAKLCKPTKVFNIVLSDIINDPLDLIASGPTTNDFTKAKDALEIVKKYNLKFSKEVMKLLESNGVDDLDNVETHVTANNSLLQEAACRKAKTLGYEVVKIEKPFTSDINLAVNTLKDFYSKANRKTAIIGGGEITVEVKGKGLGGRNQELALRLLKIIDENSVAVCVGSDGTDGPTDCAGAYVEKNMLADDLDDYLTNSDSYHYLEKHNALIKTGPTLTNVCDLYFILIN